MSFAQIIMICMFLVSLIGVLLMRFSSNEENKEKGGQLMIGACIAQIAILIHEVVNHFL